MKLRDPRLIRAAAVLAAWVIRAWMATVRVKVVNLDGDDHPADADVARYIYAFWHESLLAPVRFRARVRVLISKHADGELIALAAQRLGFGVVRGSTTRGGGGALVELWDCSRRAHLVFTPDGPRGPRRRVQPGVIVLASRSGLPVVPVGIGYARAWRARSWDRFAVPRPFSACVVVAGPAVRVPPDLGRDALDDYRRRVEGGMLEATATAERLAAGAGRRPGPHRAGWRRGPRTGATPNQGRDGTRCWTDRRSAGPWPRCSRRRPASPARTSPTTRHFRTGSGSTRSTCSA
jgi:lysophospholipid acyltransferase (LPLAT)-like uncharacterized protein